MSDPHALTDQRRRRMKRGWLVCGAGVIAGVVLPIVLHDQLTLQGVLVLLGSTLIPAGAAIGYAVAQQRCPHCDGFARGIWSYAKCPHCDGPISELRA